jgi:hypothetical protein
MEGSELRPIAMAEKKPQCFIYAVEIVMQDFLVDKVTIKRARRSSRRAI